MGDGAAAQVEVSPSGQNVRFGLLNESIAFQLRRAYDASLLRLTAASALGPLKPNWYALLTLIHENPGINQTTLSWANGRDKSSLTPVIKELIGYGYIAKQRNANDRRNFTLTITEKGASHLEALGAAAGELERHLDKVVAPQNKPLLLHLLKQIVAGG